MDFVLDDDQVALQLEFRRFLGDRIEVSAGDRVVLDRSRWSELGAMGVFDLVGAGLGLAEAAIVFEELGRAAVPGPVIPTLLAAPFVEGAADGSTVVGFSDAGVPALVEHLGDLDVLLVGRGEVVELLTDLPVGSAVSEPLDPLTPVWRVDDLPRGRPVAGLEGLLETGGLLAAAFQVGLGEKALRLAVDHAAQRTQFGRVIGKFQAIKHLLADAAVAVEVARAAVHAAAVAHDEGAPTERAAAGARIVASQAADEAARTCIQVHGGMGFTWELDAHRLLKRSWVLDASFGGVDSAVRNLAARL
jgi:alkylation response protein AidB-like acyl-CoA dehydrogenase